MDEHQEKCPNCGEAGVRPMSEVTGKRHYRCPECLWSWALPVCMCIPGQGSCRICRTPKKGAI
jgi:hypothetical protein